MAGPSVQQNLKAGLGRIFYIMGASGAGKDTLLQGCRDHAGKSPRPLVAHRYITRQPDGGTESHLWLSEAEFEQRVTMGAFAMHWSANGYRYGIGREIDQWLAQGAQVLINGSRAYLDKARLHYGDTLIPVLIRVDPARLHRRLVLRGRESEQEIDARIRRARELEQQLPPDCLVIGNNDSAEEAVSQLLAVIAEQQGDGVYPGTAKP